MMKQASSAPVSGKVKKGPTFSERNHQDPRWELFDGLAWQERSKQDAQQRIRQYREQQRAKEEQDLPPIKITDPGDRTDMGQRWAVLSENRALNPILSEMMNSDPKEVHPEDRPSLDWASVKNRRRNYLLDSRFNPEGRPMSPIQGPNPDYRRVYSHMEGRDGKDPGGNRIFQDPYTGLEHHYPEGRQAPLFHSELRKDLNRVRTDSNVEDAGKLRIGDIFRNLWYPGK